MLSDAYGYEIECVRNANHRLVHACCVSYIGDEKAYTDVRGITTDKALFFEEFKNELYYYSPEDVFLVEDDEGYELEAEIETWANKDELFDGEFEGWNDREIARFIKDYADYYDAGKYASVFICKECSAEFEALDEDHDWFNYCGEETLWGHLQMEHPEIFKEYQTLETPDMLELCYEHVIMRAPAKALDKIISEIKRKDVVEVVSTTPKQSCKTGEMNVCVER